MVGLSSISSLTLGGTAEGLGFDWGFWCRSGDCVGWLVSWIEGLSWAFVGKRVLLLNYRMHTVYLVLLQVVTGVASGRQIVCSLCLCLGEPVCS